MATPRQDSSSEGLRPAFYHKKGAIRITSLSRPIIYRRIAAGRFPAPIKLRDRASSFGSHKPFAAVTCNLTEVYLGEQVVDISLHGALSRIRLIASQ